MEAILVTIDELANYLSIKRKTLYAKVAAGEIPHYRIGSLIRFRLSEIDAWLETCRTGKKETVRTKRKRASTKAQGPFDKVITKIIDEERGKYYPEKHGKSGQIEDLGKEVNHGSI